MLSDLLRPVLWFVIRLDEVREVAFGSGMKTVEQSVSGCHGFLEPYARVAQWKRFQGKHQSFRQSGLGIIMFQSLSKSSKVQVILTPLKLSHHRHLQPRRLGDALS